MRSETTSFVSICIILFLLMIIFSQFEHNRSLQRKLRETPIKHIYVPMYLDCDIEDVCITEAVELSDDYFKDCE